MQQGVREGKRRQLGKGRRTSGGEGEHDDRAQVVEASISWNYTTWLNIAFSLLAGFLVARFLRTGGPGMLRMMNRPVSAEDAHHAH